jgi:hypothetical protein
MIAELLWIITVLDRTVIDDSRTVMDYNGTRCCYLQELSLKFNNKMFHVQIIKFESRFFFRSVMGALTDLVT